MDLTSFGNEKIESVYAKNIQSIDHAQNHLYQVDDSNDKYYDSHNHANNIFKDKQKR